MGLGVVLLFLFWFGLYVVNFLRFFLLFFFLIPNEILAGKIPHETSQAISPCVLHIIKIHVSSLCSCLLSGLFHPEHPCPPVIPAGASLIHCGRWQTLRRAADPHRGGSGAARLLSTEGSRHWVSLWEGGYNRQLVLSFSGAFHSRSWMTCALSCLRCT